MDGEIKQSCGYCNTAACAYLSRAGVAAHSGADRYACHQHISWALEELAWNRSLGRPLAVFVSPIGPLANRMAALHAGEEAHAADEPASAIDGILSRARLVAERRPPRDVVP